MINQHQIRRDLPASMRIAKGTHAGLWLDKYILELSHTNIDSRRDLIKEVSELPEPVEYKFSFIRWQEMLKEYKAHTRRIQVNGRMVVGLGNESVLEASVCLHHTYGVPYIPGSALKGLAANYAHRCLGNEWNSGGKFHDVVFGGMEDAGYITFFDALYIPGTGLYGKALAPDVVTVHHQKYYQDAEVLPLDSDDPNSIPFLSATGSYLLALAAPELAHSIRWIDITFQLLAEALDKFGIGAKTSSGYGRMTFINTPAKPLDPEVKIARSYKREIDALRDVAGQIHGYYQKWQQLTSNEARTILARAIIEKLHQAGREKITAEKTWYKELQAFLNKS